jgi:hypothetical protein
MKLKALAISLMSLVSACAAWPDPVVPAAPAMLETAADEEGVRQAFLFGFPVFQMALTRAYAEKTAQKDGRTIVNRFGHRRHLAGPADRAVTTPNNDTIASAAWLDLSSGPVVLSTPSLPGRYHSVALLDLFTDNFRILGSRDGGEGGKFFITGPAWEGKVPQGLAHVSSPTNDVWAIVRILVTSRADLPSANAAQSEFSLTPYGSEARLAAPEPDGSEDPAGFLDVVNEMLGRGPLPPYQSRRAKMLASFGIRPGKSGAFLELDPKVRQIWLKKFSSMKQDLRNGIDQFSSVQNGWTKPDANIGKFGVNDGYRASIALTGLAALPEEEAIYLSILKNGSKCYTLAVPRDIPVKSGGFWSLTLYEQTPEGRQYLFKNPIHKYSIGDRSPDVQRDAHGNIDIFICHEQRGAKNWLPSPSGNYGLTFRIYLPLQSVREGRWSLPALQVSSATR